jgi:transcription termination factor Rho
MTTTLDYPPRTTTTRTSTRTTTRKRSEGRPPSVPKLPVQPVAGILDLHEQHGFLRVDGYLPGPEDLYVPTSMIRQYGLRAGDLVEGAAVPRPVDTESAYTDRPRQTKAHPLARVDTVNGHPADRQPPRRRFADLTPTYPQRRLRLETGPGEPSTRIIDLLAPIGKGQRGMIVAQPKTGKTMLLQAIAKAVAHNHPECHLMVVLLDERPEEVTDMRRSVDAEVLASTFDRPAHEHIALADLAIERAKRLAEQGTDVVILLDSLTRLCRAHNNNAKSGGRTLSGGVDAAAVTGPKQLFGSARNLEEGGSITIVATALVDTGSRADDYFFEELKSTGNMELRLDRGLSSKRVFPAIDVPGSGTRRDDLLMPVDTLDAVRRLRRALTTQSGDHAIEILLERMKQTSTNAEFLRRITHTAP